MAPLLEARGVGAAHGPRVVLRDVTFTVQPKELWAVLGPNGAGKSTLLRTALGLHPTAGGELSLFGRPAPGWPRAELAQKVAWVPQHFEPVFGFTGLELVVMGRSPHLGALGLPSSRDLTTAREAMAALDVAYLADRPASEMSGGELRLLILARALVQAPRLLLLDEPTAFLDLRHQVECLRLVQQRVREGLGAVAVLHDVNLAASFADKVLLLRDGKVVAKGPPREVLTAGALESLYGIPMLVGRSADGQDVFTPRGGAA